MFFSVQVFVLEFVNVVAADAAAAATEREGARRAEPDGEFGRHFASRLAPLARQVGGPQRHRGHHGRLEHHPQRRKNTLMHFIEPSQIK